MGRNVVFERSVRHFLTILERSLSPVARRSYLEAPWKDVCISAFWSGPIESPEAWRNTLCRRDHSLSNTLESSVLHLHPLVFMRFFPLELFIAEWPHMRLFCPRRAMFRRGLYDLIWSLGAANSPLVPPLQMWEHLDDDARHVLVHVLGHMGKTVDNYARQLGKEVAEVDAQLCAFERDGFLLSAERDGERRWFRANAYLTEQAPRPVRKVVFTLKKDGIPRTVYTSAEY